MISLSWMNKTSLQLYWTRNNWRAAKSFHLFFISMMHAYKYRMAIFAVWGTYIYHYRGFFLCIGPFFCYFLSVNVGSYQSTICLVRTKGKLEAGRCVQSKILEPCSEIGLLIYFSLLLLGQYMELVWTRDANFTHWCGYLTRRVWARCHFSPVG
jgi:hypothetical protein